MTTIDRAPDRVRSPQGAPSAPVRLAPVLLALAAALVRVPFLGNPLAPDEGGFLFVAAHWSPGSSVYGNYFVDRPPLLIGLFGLADALGGVLALRLLGVLAVVVAVLLAGRIGGTRGAAVAAVFLSSPLLGVMEVNGELLAAPFVLGSFLFLIRSVRGTGDREPYAAALVAGVLAAAAALVKQNMVDGFVVAAVLLLVMAFRQGRRREAAARAGAFLAGALGAVAVALALAALRGTDPASLWDAVVTFRADAAGVIDTSASAATPERFHGLLVSGTLAGLPLVAVGAVVGRRRPLTDPGLLWAALAVLAWEVAGVVMGGSYWLHYLIALVPGVVLLVTACGGGGRLTKVTTALAALSTAFALTWSLAHPLTLDTDQQVASYVREHSRPGDTVVVAFGHANIVRETGLVSPYPYLWSLPARVRDPRLTELTHVLTGTQPPRWIVLSGDTLDTWGIYDETADPVLDGRYRQVRAFGDWTLLERVPAR